VTQCLASCATVGIGAGVSTDGQVLVLHDMLGLSMRKPPKFVADFLRDATSIEQALSNYVAAVKSSRFPIDAVHAW
jgi:3-methyl-2-oxobutanoate hydroxymethyltransferase